MGWVVSHHRLAFSALIGIPGLAVITSAAFSAGTAESVQEQLGDASVAMVGVFLVGIAVLGFWGEQRRREMRRLADVEAYVAALAAALGLVPRSTGQSNGNGGRAPHRAEGLQHGASRQTGRRRG